VDISGDPLFAKESDVVPLSRFFLRLAGAGIAAPVFGAGLVRL